MANHRMFSLPITTNSDKFHSLSAGQRALYFDLMGNADDDGMIGNLQQVVSYAKARKNDVNVLINEGYIIDFGTGVYCITDWLVHNNIDKNKHHETLHRREKALLQITPNSPYIMRSETFSVTDSDNRLGKDSIDKGSISERSYSKVADSISRTTTTDMTEQQIAYFISLWNDNRATVDVTEQDIAKNKDGLTRLVAEHGYTDICRTVFDCSQKGYFVNAGERTRKLELPFFISKYNNIVGGWYDDPEPSVDSLYSINWGDWIRDDCKILSVDEENSQEETDRNALPFEVPQEELDTENTEGFSDMFEDLK